MGLKSYTLYFNGLLESEMLEKDIGILPGTIFLNSLILASSCRREARGYQRCRDNFMVITGFNTLMNPHPGYEIMSYTYLNYTTVSSTLIYIQRFALDKGVLTHVWLLQNKTRIKYWSGVYKKIIIVSLRNNILDKILKSRVTVYRHSLPH